MEIVSVQLEVISTQVVSLPAKAKLLTIQTIANKPWLFALADLGSDNVDRIINIYEVGETIESAGKYIGTFQEVGGGTFVYHSFDEGESKSVK